jgi:hypothetical protein
MIIIAKLREREIHSSAISGPAKLSWARCKYARNVVNPYNCPELWSDICTSSFKHLQKDELEATIFRIVSNCIEEERPRTWRSADLVVPRFLTLPQGRRIVSDNYAASSARAISIIALASAWALLTGRRVTFRAVEKWGPVAGEKARRTKGEE